MALSTFRAKIQKNMKKLGIDALSPFQSNSISSILNKQNTLILSESGSGKSLSYTIALSQSISLSPVSISETHTKLFEKPLPLPKAPIRGALILVPTQELSLQIYKYFRQIAPWLNVSRTNCGIGEVCARIGEVKKNVESIEKNEAKGLGNVALGIEWGCIDVLISTPGLLNDIINYRIVNGLSMINPKSIVVDEADMMLE